MGVGGQLLHRRMHSGDGVTKAFGWPMAETYKIFGFETPHAKNNAVSCCKTAYCVNSRCDATLYLTALSAGDVSSHQTL